jgi:hypothetical protein
MKKLIYIVTSGEYSDYGINCVFDDKDKALDYIRCKDSDYYQIETFEANNPDLDNCRVFNNYIFSFDSKTGNIVSESFKTCFVFHPPERIWPSDRPRESITISVCVTIIDREKAVKVASDLMARIKSEEQGIC